jgi:hypothetical protein
MDMGLKRTICLHCGPRKLSGIIDSRFKNKIFIKYT